MNIHISSHGQQSDTPYYMWTYEEDWEFHADINMQALGGFTLYSDKFYQFENSYDNPYYYCWKHTISRNIHLYSTLDLKENTAKDVELLQIPIDDIRISYIYSILVKQWGLSEDAYKYYRTIKLYSEESAGLFTPIPTELLGNVSCISNPDKRVRGYVLASQTTTKRIFIYESELKELTSEYEGCTFEYPPYPQYSGWQISWNLRMKSHPYVIYTPYGDCEWIDEVWQDEERELWLKHTFYFKKEHCIDRDSTNNTSSRTFVIGKLDLKGYYEIDKSVFHLEHEFYISREIDITAEIFLTEIGDVPVFAKIDKLVNGPVYIGGNNENSGYNRKC